MTSFSYLALIIYDTILTFPCEIVFLWGRRIRVAALLYLMARYGAILYFLGCSFEQTVDAATQVFVVHHIFHVEY